MDPSRNRWSWCCFRFKGLIWTRVSRRRWILSSLSSSEEETRIGTEEGTNVEEGSQAEEGTNVEDGLQAKIFSSNLTSLLIIISLQCD
jgi:hypothetical protein